MQRIAEYGVRLVGTCRCRILFGAPFQRPLFGAVLFWPWAVLPLGCFGASAATDSCVYW